MKPSMIGASTKRHRWAWAICANPIASRRFVAPTEPIHHRSPATALGVRQEA
jgi:hypothetical protein